MIVEEARDVIADTTFGTKSEEAGRELVSINGLFCSDCKDVAATTEAG